GALGEDLGVRLDVGGEKVFWVDDKGVLVDPRVVALAMVYLALRCQGGGVVAVPVTAPNAFEQVAAAHGGRILRTKADLHALMQAATQEGVILATDANGHFLFPDFQPAADGMMAIARLLEYLATQETTLSAVAAGLPPFHTAVRTVPCPWEAKGKVMRLLNEQFKDYRSDSLDGVKVFLQEDEWVLVLPDPDSPRFYLYVEAPNEKLAQDLADKYSRVVQSLQE
ncbi:MAG: nucleotidyl transferase, partial [Anaerolineae bacterium]